MLLQTSVVALQPWLKNSDGDIQSQLGNLIKAYPSLFSHTPTCTNLIEHDVDVGDAKPISQRFYRASLEMQKILVLNGLYDYQWPGCAFHLVGHPPVSWWVNLIVFFAQIVISERSTLSRRLISFLSQEWRTVSIKWGQDKRGRKKQAKKAREML